MIQRAFIGNLGPVEFVIILFILLLIFGAGRLSKVSHAMGEAFRSFKKGLKGDKLES